MDQGTSSQTILKCSHESIRSKCDGDSIYNKVDNEKRMVLLSMVKDEGKSLKEASNLLNINYSTAKTILRVYRIEKRILKKSPQVQMDTKERRKRCFSMSELSLSQGSNNLSQENITQTQNNPLQNGEFSIKSLSNLNSLNSLNVFPQNYIEQIKGLIEMMQNCIKQIINNEIMINNIKVKLNDIGFKKLF
jgi:hypothetical protein